MLLHLNDCSVQVLLCRLAMPYNNVLFSNLISLGFPESISINLCRKYQQNSGCQPAQGLRCYILQSSLGLQTSALCT